MVERGEHAENPLGAPARIPSGIPQSSARPGLLRQSEQTVLHVAPHPDDEILGAGATLLLLRDAGWRVINVAASLGRPADQSQRFREVLEATTRAGFELLVPEPPAAISSNDDLRHAQRQLTAYLVALETRLHPKVVISPSPHDGHHGHEVVGRAVRDALEHSPHRPSWWMWGLWAELPLPTIYVPYDDALLASVTRILEAHTSQIARIDYHAFVQHRAAKNRVLGSEKVFGFGSDAASPLPNAELLCEVTPDRGHWWAGQSRLFNPAGPIPQPISVDLAWWLNQPSVHEQLRRATHLRR